MRRAALGRFDGEPFACGMGTSALHSEGVLPSFHGVFEGGRVYHGAAVSPRHRAAPLPCPRCRVAPSLCPRRCVPAAVSPLPCRPAIVMGVLGIAGSFGIAAPTAGVALFGHRQ